MLADQIIASLSRSQAINVISRLSTQVFRGADLDMPRLAAALRADIVVTGRIFPSGRRLRVQLEVAEASGGRVLQTLEAVGPKTAALHADSELVAGLASGISQAVFSTELETFGSAALPNLRSHTLLIAAINLLYRLSRSDFDRARSALEILHERSPRHPVPLAWLARWHLFKVVQGWSDDRESDGVEALSYAQRALDLHPTSSLALTMLANVHTNYLRRLDDAEALYDRALAINPNEPLAWLQRGNCLSFRGEGEQALVQTEHAVRLSPVDPARHFYESILASAALSAGRYARAVAAAQASLRLNSEHVSSHRVLTIGLMMMGEVERSRNAARQLLMREPGLTVAGFVARSPGLQSGLAQRFGEALRAAGVPEHA